MGEKSTLVDFFSIECRKIRSTHRCFNAVISAVLPAFDPLQNVRKDGLRRSDATSTVSTNSVTLTPIDALISLSNTKKNMWKVFLWDQMYILGQYRVYERKVRIFTTLRLRSLWPLASVWSKTALNTGGVGGAGADTQTWKMKTSFFMSLEFRMPIFNIFQ